VRKHNRLKDRGAKDYRAGKPISAFESLPYKRLTELMRGSYEIGWRDARDEARAAHRESGV
jgi:ribosome modulation factor